MEVNATQIDLYRLLAAALSYPNREGKERIAALGQALEGRLGPLNGPVRELLSAPADEGVYLRLFESGVAASPHETEYGVNRSTRKAVELADIAGFYRAFGVETSQDMVDHVAAELDFLAFLGIKLLYAELQGWQEQREVTEQAYRSFVEDHAGRWLGAFADQVQRVVPDSFYARAAALAHRVVELDVTRLGLSPARVERAAQPPGEVECGGCGV
ncbi:MAG: molecular chaperone TorD family protein [Candidatus Eremiobacterota bacterium]